MAIEKINFGYPRGSLQSVFDGEAVTALELSALTSKKVDECVDLVNGVEQIAIEATAVVDDMHLAQEQFLIDNADTRAQLITDNQGYIDGLETAFQGTTTELTNTLNTTKASMDLALSNYQSTVTTELNEFTTGINATKDQVETDAENVIANASQQITNNVNSKIDGMVTSGELSEIINTELLGGINTTVNKNLIVVSETEPPTSDYWYEVKTETNFEITDGMIFVEI